MKKCMSLFTNKPLCNFIGPSWKNLLLHRRHNRTSITSCFDFYSCTERTNCFEFLCIYFSLSTHSYMKVYDICELLGPLGLLIYIHMSLHDYHSFSHALKNKKQAFQEWKCNILHFHPQELTAVFPKHLERWKAELWVFKVDSAHEKCITDAECSLMTVQYSGKRFLSPYVCERVLVLSELCDSDTFCPVSLCSVIHHSGHQVSSLQLKLDSAEQEVVGLRVRVSVVSTFYCE